MKKSFRLCLVSYYVGSKQQGMLRTQCVWICEGYKVTEGTFDSYQGGFSTYLRLKEKIQEGEQVEVVSFSYFDQYEQKSETEIEEQKVKVYPYLY